MLKKPFSINQTHKVSGVDRKKLRRSLEQALAPRGGGDNDDAALQWHSQLDVLLPPKAGELELAKLPAPSRLIIYLHDGVPILLDTSGKGDLVPTVMGLWRVPGLLPTALLKHPLVSKYIVGGADLMLPGAQAQLLPSFSKGGLLAVCSPGNPAPIAVGYAAMDSAAAVRPGAAGKLVEVVQAYGDQLWAGLGGAAVPNPGFYEGLVLPEDWDPSSPDLAAREASEAAGGAEGGAPAAAVGDGGNGKHGSGGGDASALATQAGLGPDETATAAAAAAVAAPGLAPGLEALSLNGGGGGAAAAPGAAGGGGEPGGQPGGQPGGPAAGVSGSSGRFNEDMDDLLELALLQCLVCSVQDKELPLAGSLLWSAHMLPCRPPGSLLDIKKSKHKKMSKLLQVYAKAGLLRVKEDKHSGDTHVVAINRKHELLASFRPYKMDTGAGSAGAAPGSPAAAAAAGPGSAAAAGGAGGHPGSALARELLIEEVYKPTKEVKPIFEAVGLSCDATYSAQEAHAAVLAYVEAAELGKGAPDAATLVLDAPLCDALFKGLVKKGETFPTHLPKAQLREAFLRRMQQQTRVSRSGAHPLLRKGAPPAVLISAERRQGNKRVTRISGVEAFLVDPEALAGELQRKFAASTSVTPLPGKVCPGHEVAVQGDVVDKVADYLMVAHGVPKKFFQVKKL